MRVLGSLAVAALIGLSACKPPETPPVKPADAPAEIVLPEPREGVVTDRFAKLALSCVHREYPNKISHLMNSAADAGTPSQLFPAFHGCFDWHSSVHGHWLLVRILNTDPETPYRAAILAALSRSFTPENIAGELAYFEAPDRASFERPYGAAWFLQLMTELRQADFPEAAGWVDTLQPLEGFIRTQTMDWLTKLAYPIRIGTHNQTAFAFGLMLDWADETGDSAFRDAVAAKARAFHAGDTNCPLGYEPSGEDFLSPCLMEADLMRRVLTPEEFATWLTAFLPQIPATEQTDWLAPGIVLDPTDGKLVHLDGVNLSRAWALEGIASVLPAEDARIPALRAAAAIHKATGIAAVSDAHYSGSHWLASFATYLETRRGIAGE
ncbi:MAG: DUF2891 domain-containing protein [Hyphomonas sp.]|uniref:DUF2891 domain-containing protein n=1 Tax=Hyphomonas sp. TaxID=87 RepID=UPI0017D11F81|nr:DUF2891 domain-containing protein [Hyphomonas sp.]MBA3067227.1 DUF2891 domain-containing protein [Hyphomonas sp.]MBU3919219.1 DUF2891 domain-containing protein [Alphaproteobacteria bacterium]MBU4061163.1 DUF2891 domain-containing protein [Alphaproteobacteria bacterium]MBU4165075.1 DUF2891 domain-containing protein [Alphaproteobacteria bacterium]